MPPIDDTGRLGIHVDARYRTVPEARIIEQLLLFGFALDVRAGGRGAALAEALASLERWMTMGLACHRSASGERLFDPAEVTNFLTWVGISGRDRFWEGHIVATERRNALAFHSGRVSSHHVPLPDALPAQRFKVTLRREFELAQHQPGNRLLLRLPLPLEDDALTDLSVVPIAPTGVVVDFKIAPGRLDARIPPPAEPLVELGFDATFTARPVLPHAQRTGLSPMDIELYTRPSEGLVQVTPGVRALAEQLAVACDEPSMSVQAFWHLLLGEFNYGVLHYDELNGIRATDWALENRWVDCQLGSALLVALCRARNIPARIVSGYLLYAANSSYHYWAEVWSDSLGWRPHDLMCSDLSLRGRDQSWRDYFVGRLDYRMKTQCLPRLFNYNPALPLPPAWHMLSRARGDATETAFHANDSGGLVYRDLVSARRVDAD